MICVSSVFSEWQFEADRNFFLGLRPRVGEREVELVLANFIFVKINTSIRVRPDQESAASSVGLLVRSLVGKHRKLLMLFDGDKIDRSLFSGIYRDYQKLPTLARRKFVNHEFVAGCFVQVVPFILASSCFCF